MVPWQLLSAEVTKGIFLVILVVKRKRKTTTIEAKCQEQLSGLRQILNTRVVTFHHVHVKVGISETPSNSLRGSKDDSSHLTAAMWQS